MVRLNGCQRIGIVISVVWLIGAAMYQRDGDIKNAALVHRLTYDICSDAKRDELLKAWKGLDKGWEPPPRLEQEGLHGRGGEILEYSS